MTPEEKKKADEAAKAAIEKKESDELDAAIKKEAEELAEKNKSVAKESENKALSGDYIMKVGHLSWGLNNKNHFYADKNPLINAKVMGKYSDTLKVWIKNNWIEKGSYK